jgi:hypothetical protein
MGKARKPKKMNRKNHANIIKAKKRIDSNIQVIKKLKAQ